MVITVLDIRNNYGPGARFTKYFFYRNSYSMEVSPCCNSVVGNQIAGNCGPCHDSTTVIPCEKISSDHCIRIEVRVNLNCDGKTVIETGPCIGATFTAIVV